MPAGADITVVITSCNRHDLLARTLESFLDLETERRVARIIVAEDGNADPKQVCERFGAECFRTGERVGQIRLIDHAYARVTTPFIFHLEDDWEFTRSGFMERSRAILETDPSTLLVWLRAWDDTSGHPLSFRAADGSFGVLAFNYSGCWHGFTFNPGLRRLAEYKRLGGSYARQKLTLNIVPRTPSAALPYEAEASKFYHSLGYRAVILDQGGYLRHIGGERHVTHPDDHKSVPAGLSRNAPCPCGSGKKYKHCHGKVASGG
jgi:hypothetical protein